MALEPGRTLSHYRLIEQIGAGGMGVVWKAEDTILGRTVVLKVLPAEVSADDDRRMMFFNEARLASSLSDAHIAQVHEFGRADDVDFIVMEYVDGTPLSKLLHGRPLPADRIVALGTQVARALSRAHRKGLIHRDLKPSNLMVTPDDEIKVIDFGLAVLFDRVDSTIDSQATTVTGPGEAAGPAARNARRGALVGTLPYMSPEQARGEKLDARSDIFSIGAVLYEMTTGQRPFHGATNAALIQEIQAARPRPPHEMVSDLPLELDRIVQKALASRREDRYQTVDDLAVDLRRLEREMETGSSPSYAAVASRSAAVRRRWPAWAGIGVVAAVAALAGAWLLLDREGGDRRRTVAVWPLAVHGRPLGGEILGRAFAEQIAVELALVGGLEVLPVPATAKADAEDAPERARALGAGRLLLGTIEVEAEHVKAALSLLDVSRNRLLWGASREGAPPDIPSLASGLARDAMRGLAIEPRQLFDLLENMPVEDPKLAASPDWIRAITISTSNMPATGEVGEALARLARDFPREPLVFALRARAQVLAFRLAPTGENLNLAQEAIDALEQTYGSSPYPLAERAHTLRIRGRNREALALYEELGSRPDLGPGLKARNFAWQGMTHQALGDYSAALQDREAALRLAPADAIVVNNYVNILHAVGRYDEALTWALASQALNWDSPPGQFEVGITLGLLGRWTEAVEPTRLACEMGRSQERCGAFAMVLFMAGQVRRAEEVARDASSIADSIYGQYNLASYYARAGHRAEAIECLRRSVSLGFSDSPWLRKDEDLASLRGDPVFASLVAEAERNANGR